MSLFTTGQFPVHNVCQFFNLRVFSSDIIGILTFIFDRSIQRPIVTEPLGKRFITQEATGDVSTKSWEN